MWRANPASSGNILHPSTLVFILLDSMTSSFPLAVVLACHPATPTPVVQGIQVRLDWARGGAIALTFTLEGELARMRTSAPRAPSRTDRLWEHTCFEAFVVVANGPAYYEFNFAPSGEWAAYAFRDYRKGVPLEQEELCPGINVRRAGGELELRALLHLNRLALIEPHARLRLALSAVIEDAHGGLSYWALKHPSGQPDFHHPDAFALVLEPAEDSGSSEQAKA